MHAATQTAKAQQAAIPQGLVDQVSDFSPPALTARAARVVFATGVLHRLPPFNLCISNVPGPNVPVYLCGAKLLAHYPVSVITDGQGLNITLVGYLGQLHFGLVSCRELVPDLETLASYLTEELEILAKAASELAASQAAAAARHAEQPSPRPLLRSRSASGNLGTRTRWSSRRHRAAARHTSPVFSPRPPTLTWPDNDSI